MLISISIIAFFISASLALFVFFKNGLAKTILNPIFLSLTIFVLMHIFLPVMQAVSGYYRYGSYSHESVVLTILYSLLFQMVFVFTLFLFKGSSVSFNDYKFDLYRFKSLFYIAFISFCVSIFFIYKNIGVIFLMGQSEYMRDRISLGVGQGFQILISHWVYVSCVLFFIVYLVSNKLNYKILFFGKKSFFLIFAISLLVNIFYYSINSNRNSLFVLFLLLIFFAFSFSPYLHKRSIRQDMKTTTIILGFISMVGFGFHYLGQLRHETVSNDLQSDYGIEKSLNGAFGNHENIIWLFENNFEYAFGSTYLAGFLNVVPRTVWPDKPTGAGPVLKNMIYPGDYVVGKRGNSSLTTGFITEAVMNFGFIGGLLVPFLVGVLVSFIFLYFNKTINPAWKIFLGYILVLLSTQFYYAEFLGFISRTLFTLIPIFLYVVAVGFSYKGIFKHETNSTRHG